MLAAPCAFAQTPAPPAAPATEEKPSGTPNGPNTRRLLLSAGVDWTSAYFFRGIKQETEDLILQPYGELSIKLVDNAGALTSLSLTPGTWNSIHMGPTAESPIASDPKLWCELDGYVRLSVVWWEDLTTYTLYTAYTRPSGAFGIVQEIAFGIGNNDAKLLGPFALNRHGRPRLYILSRVSESLGGYHSHADCPNSHPNWGAGASPCHRKECDAYGHESGLGRIFDWPGPLVPALLTRRYRRPLEARTPRPKGGGRPDMMDVLYLGLIVGFLALSWGLIELCDRL